MLPCLTPQRQVGGAFACAKDVTIGNGVSSELYDALRFNHIPTHFYIIEVIMAISGNTIKDIVGKIKNHINTLNPFTL